MIAICATPSYLADGHLERYSEMGSYSIGEKTHR